jgi:FkbM family methyltransferase
MNEIFISQIKSLFNDNSNYTKQSEKEVFDNLVAPYANRFVLFGSGGLGLRTLAGLRKLGIEPLAFVDNNASLWGKKIDNCQVLSPADAVKQFGSNAVFILTIQSDVFGHPLEEVTNQLNQYGPAKVVSFGHLYWKYADIFLPYYSIDLPHKTHEDLDAILEAAHLWSDDDSCNQYFAQLRYRLFLDFKNLPLPKIGEKQYFPNDLFTLNPKETFVDVGAFTGDTIAAFLERQASSFKQIITIEPDPENYSKLISYIDTFPDQYKNKILAFNNAVGQTREKVKFNSSGTQMANVTEVGNFEVDSIPLDEFLYDYAPSFIKMDIEGAEPDALLGSKRIIQDFNPILAFSVYHQFNHLWKLPLLIQSIRKDYKFYLRPYGRAGWDLVCFAVPVERLLEAKKY